MGGFDEEMMDRQIYFKEIIHKQYRLYLEEEGLTHLSDIEKVFSFMIEHFAANFVNFESTARRFTEITQEIDGIKKQLPIGDYNGEH